MLCFLALGGHCFQMLCLPGFGTHANTHNLPHFRAFPASIQEHSPPKCLFFMANAELPNRPGFALLPVLSDLQGTFWGISKKRSESTRRSTFGASPKSTPVNGRQDLNVSPNLANSWSRPLCPDHPGNRSNCSTPKL